MLIVKRTAGATLLEVLVSLTLSLLVLSLVVGFQIRLSGDVRSLLHRTSHRTTLSATRDFLMAELRSTVGGAAGLQTPDASTLIYHPLRWVSALCAWPERGDSMRILVDAGALRGFRSPRPGRDSVAAWIEGYPGDPADDRWMRASVATAESSRCPSGSPAIALTLTGTGSAGMLPHPGAPVVGFEPAMLRFYRSRDGTAWLGFAEASLEGWNTIQPAFGPFSFSGSTFTLGPDGAEVLVRLESESGDTLLVKAVPRVPS